MSLAATLMTRSHLKEKGKKTCQIYQGHMLASTQNTVSSTFSSDTISTETNDNFMFRTINKKLCEKEVVQGPDMTPKGCKSETQL